MIMAKYCFSCGAANSDTSITCKRCGKSLGNSSQSKEMDYKQKITDLSTSKKGKKYIITILTVFVIVLFLVLYFSNRGIVGTWKTDKFVSGDYEVCNTIKFNDDNTGFLTSQWLHVNEEKTYPIEWQEIDDNKYMITCDKWETVIELGSNEFVIEDKFFSVDEENVVYHRD